MVFYEQPKQDWTHLDFRLLEAYQMLQDETCPQCGQPSWLCRSSDDRISWRVNESVCHATKAREEREWVRDNPSKRADKDERRKWGRFSYATPVVSSHYPEGTELPTRKEYYENVS